jgi:hypothetical protein
MTTFTITSTNTSGSNAIIRGLEFRWAKLNPNKPVSPFGKAQWELSIVFPTSDISDDLRSLGTIRDAGNGMSSITLNKAAVDATGNALQPVTVVDTNKAPVDATSIGNGSKGAVKVFLRKWANNGKTGTKAVLMAVQITELVKYTPPMDFDVPQDGATEPSYEDCFTTAFGAF